MEKKEDISTESGAPVGQDPSHPPDGSRFVTFDEAEDGSGFYLPDGGDYFYAFDKYGGWFDEYGNYYDGDGQPAEVPEEVAFRLLARIQKTMS